MKFRKTSAKTVIQDLRATAEWLERYGSFEDSQDVARHLNNALDSLRHEDAFGTEGQCDPRGDSR